MKNKESVAAVLIPIFGIAVAILYFHQTRDYDDFESVKFPYVIATALILLFIPIFGIELKKWWRSRESAPAAYGRAARTQSGGGSPDKSLNPLYIVVLTAAFAALLPVIKSLAALFLYIVGIRAVFRKVTLKAVFLDFLLVAVLFIVFHDVLRILLPSGPVEEALSGFVRILY